VCVCVCVCVHKNWFLTSPVPAYCVAAVYHCVLCCCSVPLCRAMVQLLRTAQLLPKHDAVTNRSSLLENVKQAISCSARRFSGHQQHVCMLVHARLLIWFSLFTGRRSNQTKAEVTPFQAHCHSMCQNCSISVLWDSAYFYDNVWQKYFFQPQRHRVSSCWLLCSLSFSYSWSCSVQLTINIRAVGTATQAIVYLIIEWNWHIACCQTANFHWCSIAERGGCFQHSLFVCFCLFVNVITSERLNIGWWNLVDRCIVKKSRPSLDFKVVGPTPRLPPPKCGHLRAPLDGVTNVMEHSL